MKKVIGSLFFYALSAFGISLSITANIGVSSFNSFNLALSTLLDIRVGTVTVFVNVCFLILCFLIDRERKMSSYFIILLSLLLFGSVVNFFVYSILPLFILNSYFARFFTFLLGVMIAGFGTGRVMHFGILKFPIETLCNQLALRGRHGFKQYRYAIDIICVSISLLVSFCFGLPIFVREGTVLSLFLLSSIISWSMSL